MSRFDLAYSFIVAVFGPTGGRCYIVLRFDLAFFFIFRVAGGDPQWWHFG